MGGGQIVCRMPQLGPWTVLTDLQRPVDLAIVQTGGLIIFALLYQHAIEMSRSTAGFLTALPSV